ncbi:RNA recognition motif domain [Arabidopsis thaliana x Arabidopsis arenosa]|uniref:RNA recognition motif domain n=1 Tax=Arabidopsis thaliana x Arabidopsis arenosa TaxID=1240361 RepID=A0A8T2D1X2_9BRAS|nr:RNA recognition motif domain [Arabidopsis thaliana x Arabidopsis arenosa]
MVKSNSQGKRNPQYGLEANPILKRHKKINKKKVTTKAIAFSLQQNDLLVTKSDQANLISVKEAAVREKTLFVANLPYETKIPNIIDFFKKVGEVVRVQLIVNLKGKLVGCGFVEFASVNEAEEALQKKNGECLDNNKIFLDVANKKATYLPPKYCIDHKVWDKDYRRLESHPIEEDERPPNSVEEVLFVANLSPQTKISDIFDFFNCVGEVVSIRLMVNHEGKHVGYGFVEFASADETKKALENKNGEYLHDHKIFIDVAKTAPYPPGPKYNLVEKLCYEDYLRRESLPIDEDETPPEFVEAVGVRKKTLFVAHLSRKTEITHIINFFKDVGEVVHVRLILNHTGKHVGCAFVEFGSANEAKMVRVSFTVVMKNKYEDYLRRESLLIEENETEEGLDDTPALVEEFAVRKKTLFVANLSPRTKISHIIKFFKDVAEVVRVRLIVNHRGEHVGCGFVEFASVNEAQKALQKMNGENLRSREIFLDVVELAPYPLRPKYNHAEKLWHERESLLKKQKEYEMLSERTEFCGKKIIFSYDDEDHMF